MASSMDHKEYTEHVRYKCLLSMLSMSDDIKALPFFFSMDDSSYRLEQTWLIWTASLKIYNYLYWAYEHKHIPSRVKGNVDAQEPALANLATLVFKFTLTLEDTYTDACLSVVENTSWIALYLLS